MKRLLLLTFCFVIMFSTVAFGAVSQPGIDKGQVALGFSTFDMNRTSNIDGNWGNHFYLSELYTTVGLDNNLALFVNYGKMGKKAVSPGTGNLNDLDSKYVDLGLQYSLTPHAAILVGQRKLDNSQSDLVDSSNSGTDSAHKPIYGIAFKFGIGSQADAYLTYMKNNKTEDYVLGTTYAFDKKTYVDINYKHIKGASDSTTVMQGIGAGIGIKF